MAVQIDTKANIVSKLALGKGHTSNYREHYNESEVSSFLLSAQHIFANKINSNVASIENNGIVAGPIELELEPIFNKDGQEQSYLLKLGSTVPIELQNIINPKTGSIFSAEDRVGYVIDQRFGIGYSPILKKNGEIIYSLDASDWVLDSFGGIITQEVDVVQYLLNLGTTGTLECYVYIGSFVSEVLNISGSNAQLANELSILTQTVGTKLDISTFASISGSLGTNVAVTVTGAGLGRIVKVIGDNSSTEFTINHNLVTEDVVVSIRDNNSGEIIFASVEVLDVNNIKVSFSEIPTTSQYSVTIVGNSDFLDPNAISLLQTISADLYSLNKVNVLDFNESDYVHTAGDETISGNKTFSNDVFINGTLTVAGSATTLNTQHVLAENNLIVVNYGETGSGVTSISAGIQVDRGTENDYFFIYDENKANFRIGEENDLQAVATRDDVIADQSVVIWDDTNKKFIDSNFTIAQISGGSSISDIKDTYFTSTYQTSNYTITNEGSTVVPVISISGGFDITPNDNVVNGTRFRVHDIGNYCGTNPVTISGGALGKINTDGGAIEFAMSSLGWTLIDKFENIFDRNEITNEISSREGETLVANKFVTPSGGEGLEVRNSLDEIVALIDENGKIQGRSGEFGIIGAEYTKTAQVDFTAIGANVDQGTSDEFGNIFTTQFNSGNLNTNSTTPYIISASTTLAGADAWRAFDGSLSTWWLTNQIPTGWIKIDLGTARTFLSFKHSGYNGFPQITPRNYTVQGSNDDTQWDTLLTVSGQDQLDASTFSEIRTFTSTGAYRYYRVDVTLNNGGSAVGMSEIRFYESYATANNTFDTNLATGTAGTFAPSSFLAYDETNTLISGASKINVAYSIDGGTFVGGEEVADNPFNDGEFNTGSSTPYAVTASHETYPAWRAFDGVSTANTATWLAFTGTVGADAWIQITFPEPKRFGAWRWAPADVSGRTMANAILEGSNDSGVTWDLLDTQINQKPSQTSGAYTSMFIISNPSFYTRYRVTGSSDGSGDAYCGTSELDFREMVSVPLDQEDFKNLSDITYTTQFDLRLQLVGDQRFSRLEISTPNTIMEFTKSGEIRLLESDVAYSTLSKIGFTIPKLTTSEKDSLTPSESLMLYNETEANIEFYNGTKWISGLRKHEEIIGDNLEVNFTITHNFNTRNLTYCILDNNTYEIVDASVSFPTITTALFMFSQPPSIDEYTITIIG